MAFDSIASVAFARNVTQAPMRAVETPDRQARSTMDLLSSRLERQNMLIQTLLILLMEKNIITESEVQEWIHYVDGLDGKVDGRLAEDKRPLKCPACGRTSPPTAVQCMYCNAAFERSVVDARSRQ